MKCTTPTEINFQAAFEWIEKKEKRGFQAGIARKISKQPSYVNKIVSGEKPGTEDVRRAIATAVGMAYEDMISLGKWIRNGNDPNNWKTIEQYIPPPGSGNLSTPHEIKVLGKVPAGFPTEISGDVIDTIILPDTPENCYALKVTGESMAPGIRHGDYVLFVIDQDIEPGNVVIVNNEWGESMVKRYQEKNSKQFLVSDNPEYPSFEPNGDFRIVGKVVGAWRNLSI